MDFDLVHHKDVISIMESFQNKIEALNNAKKSQIMDNSGIKKTILNSIEDTDHELQLKTQAIVRTRLTQSKVLPIMSPRKTKNIVKTEVAKYNESEDGIFNLLKKKSKDLKPISSLKNTNSYSKTEQSICNRPRSRPKSHLLPIGRHDPLEKPPSVGFERIEKYGLQRLSESGYIQPHDIVNHVKDLVLVEPFKGENKHKNISASPIYKLDPDPYRYATSRSIGFDTATSKDSKKNKIENSTCLLSYLIPISNGIPNEKSREFIDFRRNNSTIWEQIEFVLSMIRKFCENRGLTSQILDGQYIACVSQLDPDTITDNHITQCFFDQEKLINKKCSYGFGFVGKDAEKKAATYIQSIWRGFSARRLVRRLMRCTKAAKTIQNLFRVSIMTTKFKSYLQNERRKKLELYDYITSEPASFNIDRPHVLVQIISSNLSTEIGRLQFLDNKFTTLVLVVRRPLPTHVSELFYSLSNKDPRLHILSSHFNLPDSIPMEQIFSSDVQMLNRILQISNLNPILIDPKENNIALIDGSRLLNGTILSPSPNRFLQFKSRVSMIRFLESAGCHVLEVSQELYDRDSLCHTISRLSIDNTQIPQWIIRRSDGDIALINMHDFGLFEKIKSNLNYLTNDEIEDGSLVNLLSQTISDELLRSLHPINEISSIQFLRGLSYTGGTIEAAPQHPKSISCVSFFVPPVGHPHITGSWETLFLSAFTPFASIHPAFMVPKEKLKKYSLKIASECSSKRITGTSVSKFYYSVRSNINSMNEEKLKMVLSAHELFISATDLTLNQLLLNTVLKTRFDEESMSMGPSTFAYVQDTCEIPDGVTFSQFKSKLSELYFSLDKNIFLVHSLSNDMIFGIVIIADNVEDLIRLVSRIFNVLLGLIPEKNNVNGSKLVKYIAAIDFLKSQFDSAKELLTTVNNSRNNTLPSAEQAQKIFFKNPKI